MQRFIENEFGEFDIVVIGGGISGAAVAYDAASRGYSVALVEKQDYGCATSAATSKLIHGGFRYLANLDFRVVRESLRERRILENIAPNFVYPLPVMLTSYNIKATNNKWVIKAGMMMYDILSFDKGSTWDKSKNIPLHKTVSAKKVLELEPNVKKKGLTGASIYCDCTSIFPERLTLAFIKSAVEKGASVANYAKVDGFVLSDEKKVCGVKVKDLINDRYVDVRGKLIVNCGGPWADIVLGLAKDGEIERKLRRSEGIHFVTKKLLNKHMIGNMAETGRHFFVIPWRNHTLIGTTDKEYIGDPDEYKVTKESIMELLDEVNSAFGNGDPIKYEDILHTYGGLRPLVEEQTEDVYKTSRKYEIYDNAQDGLDGLITVEGGKYTTSRGLAENVMKMVGNKINGKFGKCVTDKQYLAGCEIKDIEKFILDIQKENADFDAHTIEYLGRNYGTEYSEILKIARSDKSLAEPLNEDGEMLAQVIYAIREESALTLKDIMVRRTGIGTLGDPGDEVIGKVADLAAKELGWDASRIEKEKATIKETLKIPD